jgi:GntR family transcriptional regulator, transcriptional repressor for pyruvate dehydrogenase complex
VSLGLEPVARNSLSDAVFDQLAEQILSRRVEPGAPLPPERELAKALGVNRGAIREALKRLAQAGLVEQRHGGGTTVLDYRRHAGLDLLTRLLVAPSGEPDRHVARSIMEMRAALAPDVARLCAERADERLCAMLRELVEDMRRAAAEPEDLERLQLLSLEFWDLLVQGADNIAYHLAFNTLRHTYEQIRVALVIALADELRAVSLCAELVAAIDERDAELARRHAAAIVRRGSEGILAALELLEQLGVSPSGSSPSNHEQQP